MLLSIDHSGIDNDDSFGSIILINENKNYETFAKGLRGVLNICRRKFNTRCGQWTKRWR